MDCNLGDLVTIIEGDSVGFIGVYDCLITDEEGNIRYFIADLFDENKSHLATKIELKEQWSI